MVDAWDVFWLFLVALLWGGTNPLIKRGSAGVNSEEEKGREAGRKETEQERKRGFFGPISSALGGLIFVLRRPRAVAPLVLNQCGSVVFAWRLGASDLSVVVPAANAMTLVMTAAAARILGEESPGWRTALGAAFILFGVALCVRSKA
jgi:drug/metabolite transporter (DMT)-like permease